MITKMNDRKVVKNCIK